jgi:mono/diheme cytochrome c family protein
MSFKILQNRFSRLTFFVLLTLSITFSQSFADPTPPAAAAGVDPAVLKAGQALFEGNCKTCHAVHEKKVGPALKDILKRRDIVWIKKFVRNSQKVIKVDKDPYAVKLYAENGGTDMTTFPGFKDEEIESIVAYITDESGKAPVKAEVKTGEKTDTSAPKDDNSDLVLVLTIITLVLVLVTLIVFISVIRKYLTDREATLSEEDKEIANQKFGIGVILRSKAFIVVASIIFTCVAVNSCWKGLISGGIEQNYAPIQPIPFSHKLHAGSLKIDCGYCHTGVYRGKQANIPGVNICMNCHSQVKEGPSGVKGTNAIATLREHYQKNRPIQWVRVHNLPDLAYFNHSQHTVAGGLECKQCHGNIDSMEVVKQFSNLTMGWCINCHRETSVNGKDNAYYDRLLKAHDDKVAAGLRKGEMKVEHIGGLECSKCHY